MVLVGVTHEDTEAQTVALADKIWRLRILDGPDGGQAGAADVDAPILLVSQFTLYANTDKGRRPSWNAAAPAAVAEPLVDAVATALRSAGATVATGRFGAHMHVGWSTTGRSRSCSSSDHQPGRYGRRVRIRGPSAVTATVCSQCAARLPSSVTTVQSSSSTLVSLGTQREHRLDRERRADDQARPAARGPSLARNGSRCISRPMP